MTYTLNNAGSIFSFADDTVLIYSTDTWSQSKLILEADLKTIIDYFNNKLFTMEKLYAYHFLLEWKVYLVTDSF